MGNIDELLAADEKNGPTTRACLDSFSPKLFEALDTAAGMYHTFAKIVGQGASVDQDLAEVEECARVLGVPDLTVLSAIRAKPPASPAHAEALRRLEAVQLRIETRHARGIIYTQIERACLW